MRNRSRLLLLASPFSGCARQGTVSEAAEKLKEAVILKPGACAGLKNLLFFQHGENQQILRFAQNDVIECIFQQPLQPLRDVPQGLKPDANTVFLARLKPCPDAKMRIYSLRSV